MGLGIHQTINEELVELTKLMLPAWTQRLEDYMACEKAWGIWSQDAEHTRRVVDRAVSLIEHLERGAA